MGGTGLIAPRSLQHVVVQGRGVCWNSRGLARMAADPRLGQLSSMGVVGTCGERGDHRYKLCRHTSRGLLIQTYKVVIGSSFRVTDRRVLMHQSQPKDWENPSVISINKRKAHAELRSFTSAEQAWRHFDLPTSADTVAQSPRIHSLNGEGWSFKLHNCPEAVPTAFSQREFNDTAWSKVCV